MNFGYELRLVVVIHTALETDEKTSEMLVSTETCPSVAIVLAMIVYPFKCEDPIRRVADIRPVIRSVSEWGHFAGANGVQILGGRVFAPLHQPHR